MAIVPFRVSGPAADQSQPLRLFQIGGHTVHIAQDQAASGSLSPLEPGQAEPDDKRTEHLSNVGFVVWQSAFVLLEYLLRHPPFGQWHDVHVLELGCGTGIGGIALALAGANVTLTDLPHVLHLTRRNVAVNCQPPQHRARVCMGQPVA